MNGSPIPKGGRPEESNTAAADRALTSDDLTEIENAATKIDVQGAQYSEHMQRMIDR